MRIETWSDLTCPRCYVGKRHLETALARFEHAGEVELVWRSFELDPAAPEEPTEGYVEQLVRTTGVAVAEAEAVADELAQDAAATGLELRLDLLRPVRTHDAHRLLHHARSRDLAGALQERLLRAALTEGALLTDLHALRRLGVEAGLDEVECAAVLSETTYGDDVAAETEAARDLGAVELPFQVLDRRFAIPGAQPPDGWLEVLRQTWALAHREG